MTSLEVSKNETAKVVDNTLRSFEVFTFCPHCRKGVATRTEKKYNLVNTILCVCVSGVWMCNQMCKAKDWNCYDATHTCTSCNQKLGHYSAC